MRMIQPLGARSRVRVMPCFKVRLWRGRRGVVGPGAGDRVDGATVQVTAGKPPPDPQARTSFS